MSSGSLKDLTKAITASLIAPSLPLPSSLLEILHNYATKHSAIDNDHSQRVQDELLSIYNTQVANVPPRLAPFLNILRILKPAVRGSGRILQWWEKLSGNVLKNLATEKQLAHEARKSLLDILIWDEEDEDSEVEATKADKKATSQAVAESLVAAWIMKIQSSLDNVDPQAKFVEGQLKVILLSFGRRRPKDLLNTINKFVVNLESRILALSLLGEFIQHEPPHLHQMLQTALFDSLLKCLQIDTSTRVISLAMTALIMFLPHVPSSMSAYLPALFNIYSRMLFWERERKAVGPLTSAQDRDNPKPIEDKTAAATPWAKMGYLLESEDETVPELLHYFTFLYGLYPINFMSYIRKPQKYLRHANFAGADDLDIEPSEMRQRSESFRHVHLLHPNFFILTIESELTDTNRWMNSEAADVVAECMALYNPGDDIHTTPSRSRGPPMKVEANSDVPEHPLLELEPQTPYLSRHTSWRNTQLTAVSSTAVGSSIEPQRKGSHSSQIFASDLESSPLKSLSKEDSPTMPPQTIGSPAVNPLSDILGSRRSSRITLHQTLTNESAASLSSSNQMQETTVVAPRISQLTYGSVARSPSLRAVMTEDPNLKIAYLHREIQLLRNDLNYEKFLKSQHLSHIGHLRRKQIREARVEAETQNLINSARQLRSKLEEAKRINIQMKKETEKSKSLSRKWEADLSGKVRALREEQKKWTSERDQLKRDLANAKESGDQLRQLVVTSESRELGARQKVRSVESSLDELERLRGEVDRLTVSLRTYEAGETLAVKARESEDAAWKEVTLLEMQLKARDRELFHSQQAFEAELLAARHAASNNTDTVGSITSPNASRKSPTQTTRDILDSALASSRSRIIEIQKAHNHLLRRYTTLQNQYMDLKEQLEQQHGDIDSPLLSGGISTPRRTLTEGYSSNTMGRNAIQRSNTVPETVLWDASYPPPTSPPTSPLPGLPSRPKLGLGHLDTSQSYPTLTTGRSPITSAPPNHFLDGDSSSNATTGGSKGKEKEVDCDSVDVHMAARIKPQSEVRIYGRGGVQNIGKKEKDKKEKEKGKESSKDGNKEGETKKEKKSVGMRGIRAFV